MKKRKKLGRKLLSFLLTLALVLGLMPGMGLTAYAAPTETLLTTITATGKEQASYSTDGVATISFSYTAGGSSAYLANWGWWGYGWTATVNAAEGYTITKCVFYDDANRTATDSEAPFVVETTEEDKTPQVNGTPILAYTSKGIKKIEVYGYATPTATHSVTITAGDHMTKTAGSGDAEQTGLTGAMTDVVYTADDGYYFPTDYSVAEVSGIKVTRDSYTQITVSGTPTADAAITLTAPTAKTTPDAPTTAAATDCTTADNNDGKLTGVTTAMEYKKSDAESWTAGTGSDITGLVPGTYYVRYKATDTANASANQELTIKGFISYTVTFKVVNGKWNEGEGDAATADKTVTLTGHDGDTLKLTADQIPAVGSKPNDTYKAGSWDTTPSADTEITADTTYTYTYAQKEAATVTKAPEAKTLTYTGSAQSLVTAGSAEGGEMQYALGTETGATQPYTTSIPTATNAGTYYVWYKVVGDDNHSDSETASVTATINPAGVTLTANSDTKTYNGSEQTVTGFTSSVEGLTFTGVSASGSGTNAGEYDVTFSGVTVNTTKDTTGNYVVTGTTNGTFTIGKKAATVTADAKSKTYGAADPTLTATVEGTVGSDSINYTLARATGENVGEYAITVTLGENPNYEVTTTNGTFTIGKKAATVTADAKSKTYGAADPTLTATVEGTVGSDTLNYTLSRAEGENVGEYAITVTLGENPNYEVTTTNGTFTIGKKAATVTADDLNKVYGDADPALTATVTGLVGEDTLAYTLTRTEGENVGEYEITVTLGENPNYDVTATNGKLTITKKAATVTAVDASKVYGEDDPELTATVTGLVGEDTLNYTLSRAEGQNVGEYEITVTLGENPNYDVTATNGTFTITKKAATVTADDLSKIYGEDDPELTATVTGMVGNDTLNYTLTRAEGENAGEYIITVTLGENPNYEVAALNGIFTITKKAATVTADDLNKVYGDADPELTATVTGMVGNDTLNYTLARAEGENAGEYEITVTLGENPNYDVTATNGKLTITKADPDYTVPEGLVAIAGWTLADVTLPEGWTWNDPTTVIEEAGEQTFPATYTPEDTANYNVVENIDLTVTAKEMKFVDVPDGSYYYDAVYWAVAHDITSGTDETHFSPNVGATRAQVVTFLWRAAGSPEPTATECKFTDVKAGSYYEKAVLWAAETGVTAGTSETTFSPDDPCTRAQVVTFLWRAAGSPEPTATECKFTDVKAGSYYEKAVLWAAETGVTAGTSETAFSPDQPCTRAQVVTFLWRADKLTK